MITTPGKSAANRTLLPPPSTIRARRSKRGSASSSASSHATLAEAVPPTRTR